MVSKKYYVIRHPYSGVVKKTTSEKVANEYAGNKLTLTISIVNKATYDFLKVSKKKKQ